MDTIACHNCGTTAPAETRFCPSCGLNLRQAPEVRPVDPAMQADEAETRDADARHYLRPRATVGQGRYLVEAALDRPAAGGRHQVFLGRDTAAAEDQDDALVLEDIGSAPTTAWLAELGGRGGKSAPAGSGTAESDGPLAVGRRLAERRAQLLALDHAGLGAFVDLRLEDGRIILVRRFVAGQDLAGLLEAAGGRPLDEGSVLDWALGVLDVLVYLHGRQPAVIHGDIKPSHLILDAEGHARLIGLPSIGTPVATAKPPLGTAGYAPPEQFEEAPDPTWDLYALGATMHHLLTARDPRAFTSASELWIYPPPRWLNTDLAERTEGLIMRALEKEASKRHLDAVGMRDDVAAARHPTPRSGRRWPWPRRGA